jgi:hypothetical protein
MKNSKFFYLLPMFVLSLWAFQSCTDLEVEETDSVFTPITGNTFEGNAINLLATAYNDLNTFTDQAGIYSLYEHTSDEMIPPTRGTDWSDNGVWRTLHAHTWDATHSYINNSWNLLNGRVFRCNQVLASNNPAPTAEQAAEAKFLRAFYMFHVMDLWGKAPFREVSEGVDVSPRVLSRSEAFDFIEKDLNEALPDLPVIGPGGDPSKASKAAANTLMARLYLNKAVYKSTNPAGPYTFDNADMAKVIQHCDAVAADGYSLDPDYFHNFKATATNEVIFTNNNNGGNPENRIRMTLHYDNKPDGWNGFTTLADFYAKFEDGDQRKGKDGLKDGTEFQGVGYGFLVGQQFDDSNRVVINKRNGMPLAFTPDVPLTGATSEQGIRVMKYHAGEYGKYIFFRMGDVITMKAEAQLRSGDAGAALTTVNDLRQTRSATPLGALDLPTMLDERGRELYWEGVRRTDQIRFGTWTNTWSFKTNTDPIRVLYPIPKQALDSNPNLRQNDGY